MRSVVITGSTRGIGFGLAKAFLERGCAVFISGREQGGVEAALQKLQLARPDGQLAGKACDVTSYEQLQGLWEAARRRFERVDIWINNAGLAHDQTDFWELSPQQIESIVVTNLVGAMYGSRVALHGMREQGYGYIYNMEGLGSNRGRIISGLSLYASTKAGLRYFDDALIAETRDGPVRVGALQPGMVLTDLLVRRASQPGEKAERQRKAFNLLADRIETVAPWLVEKILENDQHGKRIKWLTGRKIMWRILSAPITKREVLDESR